MTEYNRNSSASSKQLISRPNVDWTGGKTTSPHLSRPKGYDRDEWRAYWQARGQLWRTEPEISDARQEELSKRRTIPADIYKGIYPFGGMKLDRADIEWLLATYENGRGPVVWSDEQQRTREGLDLRGADLRGDGISIVNLQNLPLTHLCCSLNSTESFVLSEELRIKAQIRLRRTDLTGAHLEGARLHGVHLEDAIMIWTHLERADLSEAHLERTDLSGARLKLAQLNKTHLEGAQLHGAHLEGTNLGGAYLEGAHLHGTHLEGANLYEAQLKNAELDWAYLERADLRGAQLEGANLEEANLDNTRLKGAHLEGVSLYRALLERTYLEDVTLSKDDGVGPFLADVQWSNTNLAVVDWSQMVLVGEEHVAGQKYKDGEKKTNNIRLREYQDATRANRQLTVALLGQGLNEDAVRFAYRANVLQRKVLWYQIGSTQARNNKKEATAWQEVVKKRLQKLRQRVQRLVSYSFSLFLDVLAGYGYKPRRTVGWYLFVVFGFALSYAFFGHLPFWPDALVYSLTSFHGRGFLPNLDGQIVTLHYPLVVMAAFEAVIGLLIEVSFIATFTQRFFGK